MTLDQLPLELIHLIAQDLSEQRDLYSLILACRRFYALFIDKLYSNVTLFKSIDESKWYSFIDSIVRQPALAEAVKSLFIHAWAITRYGVQDFECDSSLISNLVSAIPQSDEEREEWENDANAGIADAWLGLVLPRLSNLERIDIVLPHGSVYFHEVLQKAARGDIQAFSKLEEAYISWHDTKYAVASLYLMPFFHFPNMRKLGGSKISERESPSENEMGGRELPPPLIKSSGITHLDFRHSNSTITGMSSLIESCKALKSFRVGYGGVMVSDDDFYPHALVNCLKRHHKTCLERLWIDVDDCSMVTEVEDDPIGSLGEFQVLKQLHIRLQDLLDFSWHSQQPPRIQLKDTFPSSLKILFLSLCQCDHLQHLPQQLEEMIQSRRDLQLGKLYIEVDNAELEHFGPSIVKLRDICAAVGIMFEVISLQTRWDMSLETQEQRQHYESMWPSAFQFDI